VEEKFVEENYSQGKRVQTESGKRNETILKGAQLKGKSSKKTGPRRRGGGRKYPNNYKAGGCPQQRDFTARTRKIVQPGVRGSGKGGRGGRRSPSKRRLENEITWGRTRWPKKTKKKKGNPPQPGRELFLQGKEYASRSCQKGGGGNFSWGKGGKRKGRATKTLRR